MSYRLKFLIHRGLAISGAIILIVSVPMAVLIKSSIMDGSLTFIVGILMFSVLFIAGFFMTLTFFDKYY